MKNGFYVVNCEKKVMIFSERYWDLIFFCFQFIKKYGREFKNSRPYFLMYLYEYFGISP